MRWWFLLLFAFASSASADPLEDYARWFEHYSEQQDQRISDTIASCSAQNSEQVDFYELIASSMYRDHQCVSVEGIALNLDGRFLVYPNWQSIYYQDRSRVSRVPGGAYEDAGPFRIGTDYYEGAIPEFDNAAFKVTITGVVRDCLSSSEYIGRENTVLNLRTGGPFRIAYLSGYCHSNNGPSIQPLHIDFVERQTFPRVLSVEGNENLISLWPMKPEWDATPLFSQAVDAYFEVVRTREIPQEFAEIITSHDVERLDEEDVGPATAIRSLGENATPNLFVVAEADRSFQPVLFGEDDSFAAYAC